MADTEPNTGVDTDTPAPTSAPELTDEVEAAWTRPEVVVGGASKPGTPPSQTPPMSDDPAAPVNQVTPVTRDAATTKVNPFKRFWVGYWRHKAWTLPLSLLAIVAILALIPASRYGLAGYVVKQPLTVTVLDNVTQKPVSSASISVDGNSALTDSKGMATINGVKVGHRSLQVTKKYYKTSRQAVFVTLTHAKQQQLTLVATGRQVPLIVINKLTGKPLENVSLKAAGTEVKTDKQGKAIMVLPADQTSLPVSLSNGGYNSLNSKVQVSELVSKENTFSLVPTGKLYILSRQSGKIDVVKTDLDGGSRQTVVAGTGKEDDRNTVLLASRDWKYLTLQSKRDSGPAKLYLIDTATDKMSVIDEGDAAYTLVGWNDHDFVYRLQRSTIKYWQANYQAFKSYSADKKQLLTLDQSAGEGDDNAAYYQTFTNPFLIDDKLVYNVAWEFYGNYNQRNLSGRNNSLRQTAISSLAKKDLRNWPSTDFASFFQAIPYGPNELYLSVYSNAAQKELYYEYEDGQVKDADIDSQKFQVAYPTYLVSPDGLKTFWSEQRDGRQTFFVGDKAGQNSKQVAMIDDGQVYGWYSNDYLLASKKGSELDILPVAGGAPLKVADYHKPQLTYRGYGGGYGGL